MPNHSFAIRFDDNLCQLLLSYLPLKEKTRLECVSKQFQRNIYKRQKRLVSYKALDDDLDSIGNLYSDVLCCNQTTVNVFRFDHFKSILKKCSNVNRFIFKSEKMGYFENDKVIQMITKYLKGLKQIFFDFRSISERTMNEFTDKFGTTLREYGIFEADPSGHYYLNDYFAPFAEKVPQLTHLNLMNKSYPNTFMKTEINKFKSIKHLYYWFDEKDYDLLKTIFSNNKNSLTKVIVYVDPCQFSDDYRFQFEQLSQITALENLSIDFNHKCEANCSFFYDNYSMTTIADNCKSLRSLDLTVKTDFDSLQYIFDSIIWFSQLSFLKINFEIWDSDKPSINLYSDFLGAIPQLKYLYITFPNIDTKFFQNIDQNLPNIQHLTLRNLNLDTCCFKYMSRLTKIRRIEFYVTCDWSFYLYWDMKELSLMLPKTSIFVAYDFESPRVKLFSA